MDIRIIRSIQISRLQIETLKFTNILEDFVQFKKSLIVFKLEKDQIRKK